MIAKIKAGYLRWQHRQLIKAIEADLAVIEQGWVLIEERRREMKAIESELLAIGSEL